ncbi:MULTISPECIES: beta-glucoside-specific PTS transporter subunit IIABC [Enterococcus]|uniref:beta-glucoside-specific PTS transporter subunit IIABC n=1 Tax=Enterococcus TaxID=1350 RepID=UPI00032E720B|nr:beta-glucoside-specific PTS transporter subunit IIABC [Enterococcus faecium]EGP5243505.1 PTS beta-glucoside transporter subunit EIIBCA [Enterococcus faecium]EME8099324.1 PTS glucose transporter subunit IIA [Enterococcus faecium]EOI49738.1 PTS system, beta-glucoside-specific IIABC component [Enterococcus faecium EnGen0315]MBE9893519.1 PTS transporter subunit EIIC [Enterococcus faecium]MCC4052152.1 beta-glucoside-specific PTS transporter subunit IIABC [Enterococcus faecium]
MDKNYDALSKRIIDHVGGTENIISLYHCITRLRFKLKDENIAQKNTDEIKKIPGVLSVVEANNQYQVVIGNEVEDVYKTIMANYDIKSALGSDESEVLEDNKSGNIFIRFFNTLSSIFNPIIMPLAGAGMIKALLVVLTTYNFMSADGSTYKILSAAGNSVFFFLPLFLAFSAARVFRANQFISLAIVAALLEPNFTALVTENGVTVDFLGIPAILMGYSGTVIPAIISIYLYSKLETQLKRVIPKSLEIFLLPMVALLIMVPLTVLVVGPIGVSLGDGIGSAMNFISDRSGLLAGLIIGAGWTFLVMIGIHWGVVPIMINNLAVYGYDVIRPMVAAATFASAGVALGVFLRSKDKNVKVLSLSAIVPALLGGITEPIVYGLSVKYKKPLIAQTIAGGIAGAFMGAMQTKAIVYVFPALTTLPAFLGDTFVYYLIGIALAFFLSAILTFAFGLGEESSSSNEEIEEQVNEISVPLNGEVIALEKVNDPVFSEKTMGDGFAVIPTDGVIKAPFSGKVEAVFPTKHAIGLKSKSGVEVLIHIGINTVELNGKYFDIVIEAGDDIQKGQKIGSFDIEGIQSEGYDPTTVIVLTNLNDLNEVDMFDSNGKIIQTFTGKKTGQAEILA